MSAEQPVPYPVRYSKEVKVSTPVRVPIQRYTEVIFHRLSPADSEFESFVPTIPDQSSSNIQSDDITRFLNKMPINDEILNNSEVPDSEADN